MCGGLVAIIIHNGTTVFILLGLGLTPGLLLLTSRTSFAVSLPFCFSHVHVNVMYMHVCLTVYISVCIPVSACVRGFISLLDDFDSWFNLGVDIQLVVFGDLMCVHIAGRLN